VRNVLITGGNSGLGLEIVKLHLNLGDFVHSIDLIHDNPFFNTSNNNLATSNLDLSDIDSLLSLKKLIHNMEVIYLNAASATKGSFQDKQESQILKEIQVNVVSNVLLIKYFLQQRKSSGKIIVISSSVKYFLSPELELYAASKSFISTLVENFYDLTKKYDLSLFLFEPSGMRTNFQRQAGVRSTGKNLLDPKKVAQKIVKTVGDNKGFIKQRIGIVSHITYLLRIVIPYRSYFAIVNYLFKRMR
jgi:short-subunit dehydrogenase